MATKIEWAEEVWNPVTGCTKVSEGCRNCYAERMVKRLAGRFGYPQVFPFRPLIHRDRLLQPGRWRTPRRIFVCSMGDLFHGEVPDWWIDEVFEGIIRNPQHRFLLLTKRPDRMAHYINKTFREKDWVFDLDFWMTNVWAGVSVEDQAAAEERIPALLGVSAAVRFVSVEPMLEPVDLQHIGSANARSGRLAALSGKIDFMRSRKFTNKLDWVICGGESGPGARPVHPDWVRFLRDECIEAGVPFFFKQWGEHCYPGQMPEDTYTEVDASVNLAGHYDRPWKVGKKKAGRLLDGVEWNQVPHSEES